jgi:hypothetical protein
MNKDYTVFRIGGPYFTRQAPPYSEGVEFNYRDDAFTLVFSFSNFSARELEDLTGECEFGAYVEDGILFFLYRFGKSWLWSDCPYNWWLVADEDRTLPSTFSEQTRILLHVFVVNAKTNTILQMRMVSIPPSVTDKIVKAIVAQTEDYIPGRTADDPKYEVRLQTVWGKRTSLDMVKLGVTGTGGE